MKVEIISYRTGVDVLGFPIIHEHIFIESTKESASHSKKGKNMSKKRYLYNTVQHFLSREVKQL